jgi:hypothetical protein
MNVQWLAYEIPVGEKQWKWQYNQLLVLSESALEAQIQAD